MKKNRAIVLYFKTRADANALQRELKKAGLSFDTEKDLSFLEPVPREFAGLVPLVMVFPSLKEKYDFIDLVREANPNLYKQWLPS